MGMALLKDWRGRFYKIIGNLYQFIIPGVIQRNIFNLKWFLFFVFCFFFFNLFYKIMG